MGKSERDSAKMGGTADTPSFWDGFLFASKHRNGQHAGVFTVCTLSYDKTILKTSQQTQERKKQL